MALSQEQEETIRRIVWSGMWSRSRLVAIATEEMYVPEEIDADEAVAFIDREIGAKSLEERSWPAKTDGDRLRELFELLNNAGLVALMNAGNTISDGLEDVDDGCRRRGGPGPKAFGFCFFHSQDLDRAQQGGGLFLAFGDFAGEEQKDGAVGALVVERANAVGLSVDWPGNAKKRIHLTPFVWQMRGMPLDDAD
ncbi:MAG: hypothetical protein QM783_17775 [Phycisphaerales bacterium]